MNDFSCSSFSWETEDNKHLLGRTYDQFGDLNGNVIAIVPRNYELSSLINSKSIFKVKYLFGGMCIKGLETPLLVDGINEKGLMGALLRYPGFAVYDTQKRPGIMDINPGFLVTYILSVCENIEEVCKEIKNINLCSEKVFGNEIPVHYIFSDKSGKTIIVEPDKEEIKIHNENIGVLTNSPNYKWHEQNIRNYVSSKNILDNKQNICGKEFKDFGFSGLHLPGSYSSVDRFIRVALLKEFTFKGKNEIDGISKMFQNFSSVEVPMGVIGIKIAGVEEFQSTLCISCMCSESLTYYFSLINNRRINAIDLNKEINNSELKFIDLPNDQDILYLN